MSAILFPRAWTTPIFSTLMQKTLLPIQAVARKLEIPEEYFEPWGSQSGKVKLELLSDPLFRRRGKLIIVTATTPTAAGEGKTVTSISLTQGLAHIGKKVVITSREPSIGPVFRLIFALGSICERPPPVAPPFIPKTGPIEGSREVMTTFLPMCARPWVRLMEVTVFPSPAAVGVVAVTMINFPRRLNKGSESSSSLTFPLCDPHGSKYSSGISSLRATA